MSDDALMRPADRREETNFDKVWRYYYDAPEITLTDEQEKLRKRWDHVWKLMGGFLTATQIVKKHLKENPGITERTAWMDLRNAKALYGDPASQNRMAERMRCWIKTIRKRLPICWSISNRTPLYLLPKTQPNYSAKRMS